MMKMVKIRFLKKEEAPILPWGAYLLPQGLRKAYLESRRPWRMTEEKELRTAILQTVPENSMTEVWRKQAGKLLEHLKQEGTEIILPPLEGELPQGILPFADGRRLQRLFAFAGAAEALRRQGKHPEKCRYLLAGGDAEQWRTALLSAGNEVNHLSIFTSDPKQAAELTEELLEERGLMTEVFSSPKNPLFSMADAVFCCGMERRAYEYMLGEGAVWIDLSGNHSGRLQERRPDVMAADGFFFRRGAVQRAGELAEAEAFLTCPIFRENWQLPMEKTAGRKVLGALQAQGYAVSGFSFLGKRVKIMRKP